MTPDNALRLALREALDEVPPPGKTDADTRFTDAQIDALLERHDSIEEAAAEGWRLKAARALSERGGLVETQVGSERFKFVTAESFRQHALEMAAYYDSLLPGVGSRIFSIEQPDVLGTPEPESWDISRLVACVEV